MLPSDNIPAYAKHRNAHRARGKTVQGPVVKRGFWLK
jgi:hypothetical protein